MQYDEIMKAIFNYGFPSAMLIAVSIAGWKILNRVITYNKEREDKLMDFIQGQLTNFNKTLLTLNEQLIDFRKANDQAHSYQKDEHEKILDKLEFIKDKIKCGEKQ